MTLNKIKYDLDGSWSIGSQDYLTLMKHVDGIKINQIVELGSGQSTFQIAEDFPNSILLSLENDPEIANKNSTILGSIHKPSSQVVYAPVKIQHRCGMGFITYDFNSLNEKKSIDLLIVDGPVERLYPMGREASLYFLFDKLAIGAIIGLDDYHRVSGKKAVNNWLSVFDDSLKIKEETSTFAVLVKISECSKPKFNLSLAIDSYTNFRSPDM